jgi:hypothetical protein
MGLINQYQSGKDVLNVVGPQLGVSCQGKDFKLILTFINLFQFSVLTAPIDEIVIDQEGIKLESFSSYNDN